MADLKHFASWLGLAPQKNQSGGRERPAKTAKDKHRSASATRMAAQSLSRSQSALGAFYRRVRAKHGGPAAIVATAHKLARMIYFMLKYRQNYVDPGQDYYEQQYRERVLKNLNRKAKALGMETGPGSTGCFLRELLPYVLSEGLLSVPNPQSGFIAAAF